MRCYYLHVEGKKEDVLIYLGTIDRCQGIEALRDGYKGGPEADSIQIWDVGHTKHP